MEILFLSLVIVTTSLQSVFKKRLNQKCTACEFSVGTLISSFSLLYFLIVSKNLTFTWELFPYSLAFAICYAVATVTCVLALNCGPLAFTELMLAYSSTLPLLYGIIFMKDPITIWKVTGILLLLISFIFTYYKPKGEKQTFKKSWIIYVILLFLSNGGCGVFMRMQQNRFSGAMDSSFMVSSLIMVVIFLLTASLVRKENILLAIKRGWYLTGFCGACNGAANYFSLLCLLTIPGTIYYPFTSAGGLTVSYIISVVGYKEKFRTGQVIGFILGVLSMILVNLSF